MSKSEATRARICQAAIRIAGREGIRALTLDKVAVEAELSKGGVTYHFPDKDELLRGLVESFGNFVESKLVRSVAEDSNPNFRWARAILRLTLESESPKGGEGELTPVLIDQFMMALLSMAVHNPEVVQPILERGKEIRSRILLEGESGLEQILVWLAIDGLFLWEFAGLMERGDPLRKRVEDYLAQQVDLKSASKTTAKTEEATHADSRKRKAVRRSSKP